MSRGERDEVRARERDRVRDEGGRYRVRESKNTQERGEGVMQNLKRGPDLIISLQKV